MNCRIKFDLAQSTESWQTSNFFLQFTFSLQQYTFSCNSLVHDPTLAFSIRMAISQNYSGVLHVWRYYMKIRILVRSWEEKTVIKTLTIWRAWWHMKTFVTCEPTFADDILSSTVGWVTKAQFFCPPYITTGWAKCQVPFFSHKKLAHFLSNCLVSVGIWA